MFKLIVKKAAFCGPSRTLLTYGSHTISQTAFEIIPLQYFFFLPKLKYKYTLPMQSLSHGYWLMVNVFTSGI